MFKMNYLFKFKSIIQGVYLILNVVLEVQN